MKPTFLACNTEQFMQPFWNLQKLMIFSRTVKSTLAGSLKLLKISRIYFCENLSGVSYFFYFNPGNLRQNKAQPLDIPQNCLRSLGSSKAKGKDPWKFHMTFFWSLLEIPIRFLLTPRNSMCYFFYTPGNPISSTPLFWFFME